MSPPEETSAAPTTTAVNDLSTKAKNDSILFGEQPDSDKDGLSDLMEKQLGTNSNNTDSDRDGLIDGDEVMVWKTDPLNADTDGDGFNDGVEIKNGYNPNGPGRLASVANTATSTATGTE